MTAEENEFQKRIIDLADQCDRRGAPVFTDFLNLNEQNIYHCSEKKISYVTTKLFGGYENAERQMLAFIPDALSFTPVRFPVVTLVIRPLNLKFSENLTHRDYLGAILNLGIDRSKTGDIVITDTCAYLWCTEKIAPFICRELTRIRHTSVYCEETAVTDLTVESKTELLTGTVSSPRLDAILSLSLRVSRSSLMDLAGSGKVFVNGRMIIDNSTHIAEGDLISIRGYGRFRLKELGNISKKGRQFITIEKFCG